MGLGEAYYADKAFNKEEKTMPEFEEFPKIPRWKREIIITEKLDGTNAQIYIPAEPSEPLMFGSRNRWLSEGADNYGFYAWGKANEEALRRLGPGRHYGEWWGAGIQRRYGMSEKRFYLFNRSRFKGGLPEGIPANVGLVPLLYIGPCSEQAIEDAINDLRTNGSKAVPFMDPEGVVIFHVASGCYFKRTIKDDDVPKLQAQAREDALKRANGMVESVAQ